MKKREDSPDFIRPKESEESFRRISSIETWDNIFTRIDTKTIK